MTRFILFAILIGFASTSLAQHKKIRALETLPLNAKVQGFIEGERNLVVLKVIEVDSNDIGLRIGGEYLFEFYFGTKGLEERANMLPLKQGDFISVRVSGKRIPESKQFEYLALHYVTIPKHKIKAKYSESLISD